MTTRHRDSNTSSAGGTVRIDESTAQAVLDSLPPAVRRYMLFDSPIVYNPLQVRQLVAQLGEAATLRILRESNAADTRRMYPGLLAGGG
jgi:hypothetical protein